MTLKHCCAAIGFGVTAGAALGFAGIWFVSRYGGDSLVAF